MPFDPYEFLEKNKQKKQAVFDPDKFLAESAPSAQEPEPEDQGYFSRVSGDIDRLNKEDVARVKAGGSPLTSGLRLATESAGSLLKNAPGLRKAYELEDKFMTGAMGELNKQAERSRDKRFIDQPILPKALGAVGRGMQFLHEKSPQSVRDIAATAGGMAEIVPVLRGAGKVTKIPKLASKAVKGAGGQVETFGKKIRFGEMKISTSVAKKAYGKSLIDKKKTIINDLAEFGITKGDNTSAARDAIDKASEWLDKADKLGMDLAANPKTPKVNPTEVALRNLEIQKISNVGSYSAARNQLDKILFDMSSSGHDVPTTLDQLIAAKKSLNRTEDLFTNGPMTLETAIDKAIRRKMYLNIVDEIGEISPELKALNQNGKRLLDVHAALDAAAGRIANHDAIGLTDFILGGVSISNPGSLFVTAPAFIAKKAFGGGRLGNTLISTGRFMGGKKPKTISGTLGDIAKKKEIPTEIDTWALLPKRVNVPAYYRKGYTPEIRLKDRRFLTK